MTQIRVPRLIQEQRVNMHSIHNREIQPAAALRLEIMWPFKQEAAEAPKTHLKPALEFGRHPRQSPATETRYHPALSRYLRLPPTPSLAAPSNPPQRHDFREYTARLTTTFNRQASFGTRTDGKTGLPSFRHELVDHYDPASRSRNIHISSRMLNTVVS